MTDNLARQESPTTEESLLSQAIAVTKQTDPDVVRSLMTAFVGHVMKGVLKWDKNISVTVETAIQAIDQEISKQLATVMHSNDFRILESAWRGLHYLVMNSETSTTLKIKLLNITKREVFKDLDKAVEFDQSQLFKKVYESEFGTAGGEPYSVLVADYEFTNHPDDIGMLRNLSGIAAAGFCPVISAASAPLFGFDSWTELSKPRDLAKIFDSGEYTSWRGFRESDDSRFVALTLPRSLSRLPYGPLTNPIEEFNFEEAPLGASQKTTMRLEHDHYAWMNSAYVLAGRLTNAFAQYGWCTAIRGAEGGGKVESLPLHIFKSDDGDIDSMCPTEIGITDRREAELSGLGFLPLCHYKNTDYAVFFGAQTTQKPQKYDRPEATANAAISARLPYMMAASRFAHYLKVMGRDKIGSFMEASNVEVWLNRWIMNYVNANPDSGQEMKAKYPLAEAVVKVEEIPGRPGSYNAVAWLRPWLQMEELTTSLRLVAQIPKMG